MFKNMNREVEDLRETLNEGTGNANTHAEFETDRVNSQFDNWVHNIGNQAPHAKTTVKEKTTQAADIVKEKAQEAKDSIQETFKSHK